MNDGAARALLNGYSMSIVSGLMVLMAEPRRNLMSKLWWWCWPGMLKLMVVRWGLLNFPLLQQWHRRVYIDMFSGVATFIVASRCSMVYVRFFAACIIITSFTTSTRAGDIIIQRSPTHTTCTCDRAVHMVLL